MSLTELKNGEKAAIVRIDGDRRFLPLRLRGRFRVEQHL